MTNSASARAGAGVAIVLVLGVAGFKWPGRVPLFSQVDLGFHELGHMLTYPFPDMITAVMGSVAQVAVPIGLAAYFFFLRHDDLGTGVCLAWAAESAVGVAVYIADAPYELLELLGGGEHDWAFLMRETNHMNESDELANVVRAFAVVCIIVGAAVCTRAFWPQREPSPPPPSLKGRVTLID